MRHDELFQHEQQYLSGECELLDTATLKGGGVEVPAILYKHRLNADPKLGTQVSIRVAVRGTSLIIDTRWES